MKVAVVGSRCFENAGTYVLIEKVLDELGTITEIVSGGAKGIDSLAELYANENKIPKTIFLPEWKKYGKAAGMIRNKFIIERADLVIAFWDGESKGTKNSINLAKKLDKTCHVHHPNKEEV